MGKVSSRYWSDVYVGAPDGEDPCMGWCGCHAYHGASTIQCWKHVRGCLGQDGVGMGATTKCFALKPGSESTTGNELRRDYVM